MQLYRLGSRTDACTHFPLLLLYRLGSRTDACTLAQTISILVWAQGLFAWYRAYLLEQWRMLYLKIILVSALVLLEQWLDLKNCSGLSVVIA